MHGWPKASMARCTTWPPTARAARGRPNWCRARCRVITARMDYLPRDTPDDWQARRIRAAGAARRRHRVDLCARPRLSQGAALAAGRNWPSASPRRSAPFGHRVFTDSAPVLEAELASRSGQGWRGKHTLVLDREAGSMFFLGEIYVDMALPRERAGHAALRQLQRLHRRLPDAGHHRAAPARRAALHLLPDDRACRADPGRAAAADRQPHLRLRRLPADLPLEQVRAEAARCPISMRATA